GDSPLRGRRVLHLVEQKVIKTAIEFVEHPRGTGVHEQPVGTADQVIKVDERRAFFPGGVGAHDGGGERNEGGGGGGHARGAAFLLDLVDALLFDNEWLGEIRIVLLKMPAGEIAGSAGFTILAEEFSPPVVPALGTLGRRQFKPLEKSLPL